MSIAVEITVYEGDRLRRRRRQIQDSICRGRRAIGLIGERPPKTAGRPRRFRQVLSLKGALAVLTRKAAQGIGRGSSRFSGGQIA
jgi:hypothetical protein